MSVNTGHIGFFLDRLEKLRKECMGGSHIAMNITPIVPGDRPLMIIG